jgi:hypothetical protein
MDVSPSPPDLESRGIPGFVCTPPEQIGKVGEEAMAAEENGGADRVTIGVCVMEKKVRVLGQKFRVSRVGRNARVVACLAQII